ncbi:MAG: conjugal transfer protein TraG N-terminal domain-containing protein [Rubrivivax sp.]
MAITSLTVHAYGNVDALHGIFNAIAMITSSNDFSGSIRIAVVLGFAVVLTLAIFPENLRKGWQWLIAVMVITGAMLLPTATVTIEDKLGVEPPSVVDNVPWSLALIASVKTTLGYALTQLAETAFQTIPKASLALPAELSYLQHGMMFGSRMVRSSRDATAQNQYDQIDLVQYIRNCVFPEMGRKVSPNDLAESGDLRTTMASSNMGLATGYHDPANNYKLVVDGCANVWANLLGRVNAAGANAVKQAAARDLAKLYQKDPAAAIDALEQGLPAIYGKAAIASASSTAADIMAQNILINATADAAALQAATLNDSTMIQLASMRTQAVAQMNAGNVVQGRIGEEALPLIRNATEAILYASFPFLCILLVASEGRAMGALFRSYVYVLVWVEMWPVMFAIVSYLQTNAAAAEFAGAGFVSSGTSALSVSTASAIYSSAVSGIGTAAWMVTFVPVLAAGLIFGFDRVMSITGAMGAGQRGAEREAAAATKGNLSLGNVSFDQQQLMAMRTDPTVYRRDTLGGTEFGSALSGATALAQYRMAQLPVSLSDTAAVTREMASEAAVAESSAQRNSKAHDKSIDAAYGTVQQVLKGYSATATKVLGFDVGSMAQDGTTESDLRQATDRIEKRFGITNTSAVGAALRAGISTPGALKLLSPANFGVSVDSQTGEQIQAAIASAADDLRARGLQRKRDVLETFRHSDQFQDARRSNREASDRVDASVREAEGYRQQASFDHARSEDLRTKIAGAERFQREASVRWDNLLDQFARANYPVSVQDGVADPRQWQPIVRAFIESGTIRRDTDDGQVMWIPPDPGMGLNVVTANSQRVKDVAAGGSAALQAGFDAAEPGGGREAVLSAGQRAKGRVAARGAQLGVQPGMIVGGGTVVNKVNEGIANTNTAINKADAALGKSHTQASNELVNRAARPSVLHVPGSKAMEARKEVLYPKPQPEKQPPSNDPPRPERGGSQ